MSHEQRTPGLDLARLGAWLRRAIAGAGSELSVEGVHYRYQQRQTVGEGFAHIGEAIRTLLDGGLSALNNPLKEYS